MAVSYTSTQFLKAYLAGRGELLINAQEKITSATTGTPCKCEEKEQTKILFLLFCMENIDHLDSDSEKDILISKTMAAGKFAPGLISDGTATTFEATVKGTEMVAKL